MSNRQYPRGKGYAKREDRVVDLRQPGSISDDPLTAILRHGARELLAQAIEAEVTAFIEAHAALRGADGRRRVVCHALV